MLTKNDSAEIAPMVRNYVKKGGRGSHEFCLTINGIECDKVVIGEWFLRDNLCSDVCVSEEAYHDSLDPVTGEPSDVESGKHQHCYLKTVEPMKLVDLREYVLTLTDDIGFDLQPCKSRKSWLIYITKEDCHPFMKNVRISELSLYARAQHHIKTKYRAPRPVDTADHFMVAAGNFRNVCINMADNHIAVLREKVQNDRITMEPNMQCWLTRAIFKALVNREHVYIYGLPGLGKTELIDRYVQRFKCWRAGAVDRFMFGTLQENHEVVLFEDFKPFESEKMLPTILSIMDKKPVAVSEKFKNDSIRMFNAQCIFVSNETIPSCMSMLERRVRFFCVDHRMYDCVSCLYLDIN